MKSPSPARLAAGVLLLVWALAPPAAGDVISDVGAIPNPFSPNADGVFDSTAIFYSLSEQAAVVVSVADSAQSDFLTLWSGWEDPGVHGHWWDGMFEGGVMPDGAYHFLIEAIPQVGGQEEAFFRFTLDTVPLEISHLEASPSRFSPDADGVGDSLAVTFGVEDVGPADQVTVSVRDLDGGTVRVLHSGVGSSGGTVHWDGTDDSGGAAPDGLYLVKLEAMDAAGNSSEAGLLVDADTAPPTLGVVYPDTSSAEFRVGTTEADITGWASDRAGVVGVEVSVDQEEWVEVTFGRADTVTWQTSLACTACVPDSTDETRELFVRARDGVPTADGQGHINGPSSSVPILAFDVIFDVAPPEHNSSSIVGSDNIFEPGETVTISTLWDGPGYEIEADFSAVDSAFDPAEVSVTEPSSGRYDITYEISSGNTLVPVFDAPVPVTATDSFARSAADTTVTVTVLQGTSGPAGLSVDVNHFNPLAGESVTVSLGTYTGPSTLSVFNLAGTLVRTIEREAASTVTWYGVTDDDEYVASGVYFLRIETNDGDAIRKVAVVK